MSNVKIYVKSKMAEKNLDILLSTNPANMNYVSGYDGHSVYVPQGVAVFIEEEEPIWMDQAMDVAGAQHTTWLKWVIRRTGGSRPSA